MSAVICLHASAQVSGSEVCVNLGGLPEWVKSSATSAPNTFVYLLLLNALIGLLFNMAKLVQLFGPVCEVIIIFRNLFTSEDTPDNYGPDFVVTDELLTKAYLVTPCDKQPKMHVDSGCQHIRTKTVAIYDICKHCCSAAIRTLKLQ